MLRVPDTCPSRGRSARLRAARLAPVAVILQFPVPFLARGVDRQSLARLTVTCWLRSPERYRGCSIAGTTVVRLPLTIRVIFSPMMPTSLQPARIDDGFLDRAVFKRYMQ